MRGTGGRFLLGLTLEPHGSQTHLLSLVLCQPCDGPAASARRGRVSLLPSGGLSGQRGPQQVRKSHSRQAHPLPRTSTGREGAGAESCHLRTERVRASTQKTLLPDYCYLLGKPSPKESECTSAGVFQGEGPGPKSEDQ